MLENIKAAVILYIFFVSMAVLLGMLYFIPDYLEVTFIIAQTCQFSAFFVAGIGYAFLLKKYPYSNIHGEKSWLYTLLLSLFIFGALFVLYFITGRSIPMMALGSTSAFILPFIMSQLWLYRHILEQGRVASQIQGVEENMMPKEVRGRKDKPDTRQNNIHEIEIMDEPEDEEKQKQVDDMINEVRQKAIIKEQSGDKPIREEKIKKDPIGPIAAKPDRAAQGSKRKGKTWYYTEPGLDQQPVIFLNNVPLYVQISVKKSGNEELFSASGPLEIKLGDLFDHFVTLKRKKRLDIDILDAEQKSYAWKFYAKGLTRFKNRELDPELSLRKNRIKEMAVIIARRDDNED